MKVGNLLPARPNWYDRGAQERGATSVLLAQAPHGTTARWSYTVPANKKFLLEAAQCTIIRQTVAAPVAQYNASIGLAALNGQSANMPFALSISNVVDARVDLVVAYAAVVIAGGILTGADQDTSTGGTCAFIVVFKGTEYDA